MVLKPTANIQPRPHWGARLVFLGTGLGILVLLTWWIVFFSRQSEENIWMEMRLAEAEARRALLILNVYPEDPVSRLREIAELNELRIIDASDRPNPVPFRSYSLKPAHPNLRLIIDGRLEAGLREEVGRKRRMLISEGSAVALLVLVGIFVLYRNWMEERRLNASMDFFISAINHELKTPLTSVRLLLETVIKDPSILSDPGALFSAGLRDVDRLQKMVDVILLSNRLAQGPLEVSGSRLNLKDFLERFAQRADTRLAHCGGVLQLDAEARIQVDIQEEMLERILENLLENSIKYCQEKPCIEIKARLDGKWASLEFSDQGIGVSKEEIKRIFDRFYRSKRATSQRGVGLGLFVSRMIVEAAGGSIRAESDGPDRGIRFIVRLPRVKGDDA